ncbi:MAG: CoA-binding protein, partial [Promethearchaeota archaeon]
SVLDLPVVPDLAFLILPPRVVPQVMEECGQKGIKNLLITSGGFREIGEEGKALSQKIDEIAKKYNMRFIGPNCLGIYNGWYGYPEKENAYFNTLWIYLTPERGNVSIVSQSGTIAAQISWHARDIGLKIGKSISVGNERNIDIVDFLEYFQHDPQTEVIGLYIEEIKRGRRFIELIEKINPQKPIVAIYAGGTKGSERSIQSHTGAIGGNQKIYDAIFKKAGVVSTNYLTEFMYFLRTFSFAQKFEIYPKGKRVGIISDSGGAGTMMTKTLELYGLEVPEFSKELQKELSPFIPPTGSGRNPVDVTFDINFLNLYFKFPKILMKSGEVDSIIVYGVYDFDDVMRVVEESGQEVDENLKNMGRLIERGAIKPLKRLMKKYSIPVFFSGPFPYRYNWNRKFIEHDIPIFSLWDAPTKCMAVLTRYSEFIGKFS